MIILVLFLVAFIQQSLIAFNIRNISQGRVWFAAATSFLIATGWGAMVVMISSRLDSWFNLVFYGLGASCGGVCSILFDKYFYKRNKEDAS